MSSRYLCFLALPLVTLVPIAFAGCSAGGSDTGAIVRPGSGGNSNGSGGSGNGTSNGNSSNGGAPVLVVDNGGSSTGGMTECGQVLAVTYRDFKGSNEPGGHVDFEASGRNFKQSDGTVFKGWNEIGCGLVNPTLTNSKPTAYTGAADVVNGVQVHAGLGRQQRTVSGAGCYPNTGICGIGTCAPWSITPPNTFSIQDGNTFAQWYNTTPSVNMEIPGELMLVETPAGSGVSVYDSTAFFPIDGQGFGNTPGQSHNYSFTTEIHVKFTYQAKQKFTFRGDDDLWIFVNGKLALDVGGQHQALEGTIDFDAQAATLGIAVGSTYPMDIFHAERQTTDSNFRIETNIKCFEPNDVLK